MFGILVIVLICVGIALLLIGIDFYDGRIATGGAVSGIIGILLLLTSVTLNMEAEKEVVSSKNIQIREIMQQVDGKYLVITREYEKIYPEVEIVSSVSRLMNLHYKQTNVLADWMAFDEYKYVLYLNLEDVSTVSAMSAK